MERHLEAAQQILDASSLPPNLSKDFTRRRVLRPRRRQPVRAICTCLPAVSKENRGARTYACSVHTRVNAFLKEFIRNENATTYAISLAVLATAVLALAQTRPLIVCPTSAAAAGRGATRRPCLQARTRTRNTAWDPTRCPRKAFRKGEIRGPFTLPCNVYPGTQHTYWVYVPQYDPAVPVALMIYQDGQASKTKTAISAHRT